MLSALLVILLSASVKGLQKDSIFLADFIPKTMSQDDKVECNRQFDQMGSKLHPDIGLRIDELLLKYGYSIETIEVVTEDGYVLTLFRIPGRATGNIKLRNITERRKPVLLVHGMGANGFIWFIQPDKRNFATLLVNEGFDVYIANLRGTKYSKRHVKRKVEDEWSLYWDFSFHEIGIYDISALIDAVLRRSGAEKLYYVGHSLGTTQLVVLLSERPEYNDKVSTAFLLSPAIFLRNSPLPMKIGTSGAKFYNYLANPLLHGRLDFQTVFNQVAGQELGEFCGSREMACSLCANFIYMRVSYNPRQMNYTTIGLIANAFPDSVSTKENLHTLQQVNSQGFCQFDYGLKYLNLMNYGKLKPPCYNLEKIRVPMIVYWGNKDNANTPKDVQLFWNALPKEARKEITMVNWDGWSHVDFMIAVDADVLLYRPMIEIMKSEKYG